MIGLLVAGADDWEYVEMWGTERIDWLRQFVPLENGIPSHDTIGRVFAAIDSKYFQTCFARWVSTICTSVAGEVVAFDGKTMRGSHHRRLGKSAIHVVSAFVSGRGITLGQLSTDAKSNEITSIPLLLGMLDVKGSTVTIDAMGCQTAIAAKIVEKGAHYVFGLKGNQGKLEQQVAGFFEIAEQEDYKNLDAVEDNVADPGDIWCVRIELSIQDIGCNRQIVFAVGCVNEFTLPDRLQSRLTHQTAHPTTTNRNTLCRHCCDQTAAAVTLVTGCERRFQMDAVLA